MPPTTTPRRPAAQPGEEQSLDLVQRMVVSALIAVVIGLFAGVLALYLVLRGEQDLESNAVVGLWVMTGLFGLVTLAAILLINRRRPWHPLVLIGLLPMIISGYWLFLV